MPTPSPLLAEAERLEAQANELVQGDLYEQAYALRDKAAELRREAGITGDAAAHVEAYRDHLRAERIHAQMAAANSKVRAALSDIYSGRLTCSLHPRHRLSAH